MVVPKAIENDVIKCAHENVHFGCKKMEEHDSTIFRPDAEGETLKIRQILCEVHLGGE